MVQGQYCGPWHPISIAMGRPGCCNHRNECMPPLPRSISRDGNRCPLQRRGLPHMHSLFWFNTNPSKRHARCDLLRVTAWPWWSCTSWLDKAIHASWPLWRPQPKWMMHESQSVPKTNGTYETFPSSIDRVMLTSELRNLVSFGSHTTNHGLFYQVVGVETCLSNPRFSYSFHALNVCTFTGWDQPSDSGNVTMSFF